VWLADVLHGAYSLLQDVNAKTQVRPLFCDKFFYKNFRFVTYLFIDAFSTAWVIKRRYFFCVYEYFHDVPSS
jgi:hypothetical protein